MRTRTVVISLAIGALLLHGCGSSSSDSAPAPQAIFTDITVERGPVLGAVVTDSMGNRARQLEVGKSVYRFDGQIHYPIAAQGGYIDVNRNGNIDTNDAPLLGSLRSSQGNVVTVLTTVLQNNPELLETVVNTFGLDPDELYGQTPGKNSRIAALSDGIYEQCLLSNIPVDSLDATDVNALVGALQMRIDSYESLEATEGMNAVQMREAHIVNQWVAALTGNQLLDAIDAEEESMAMKSYRMMSHTPESLVTTFPLATLNDSQENFLATLWEEEKLARDVYLALYQQHNLRLLRNIAASEQEHMDATAALLTRYSIEYPLTLASGTFANETFQTLYNTLVAQGSASLGAALQVGASIEQLDIDDIDHGLTLNMPTDVRTILQNLRQGSVNHLSSFHRLAERVAILPN
ncbi:DUF2202 domain-containing protein [Chrysiogenes arsenatis]|uniref:DUF2202 domain-containing protein n=1 Tax=Chrysiogenes arsenatis TaxID=309797 RepID=UPI0003FEA832|nr:DUF2202 domain-containing protein [Chrysiogenes arsenatis]